MSSSVIIHDGDYQSIPDGSSPGLVFLKTFIPVLDSLGPEVRNMTNLVSPEAQFLANGSEPKTLSEIMAMFARRGDLLSSFGHHLSRAWDIENRDDSSQRTVMYESKSTTVFKQDKESKGIVISEFNIIELAKFANQSEGVGGWKAVEIRYVMDTTPIAQRLGEIQNAAS